MRNIPAQGNALGLGAKGPRTDLKFAARERLYLGLTALWVFLATGTQGVALGWDIPRRWRLGL